MFDALQQLDRQWFIAVNTGLSNPFFDLLMPILRNPPTWIPLYVFIIGYSIYRYRKTGLYFVLGIVLTFAITDGISAGLLKHWIKRVRPCNDVSMQAHVISRIGCCSGYSFPSAHAFNHFAIALFIAVVLGSRYRWIWPVGLLWAASISFAQVYVGVHYPIDVTVGGIMGAGFGTVFAMLYNKYFKLTE
jgi:membrane-associated phospholipid phosphatase